MADFNFNENTPKESILQSSSNKLGEYRDLYNILKTFIRKYDKDIRKEYLETFRTIVSSINNITFNSVIDISNISDGFKDLNTKNTEIGDKINEWKGIVGNFKRSLSNDVTSLESKIIAQINLHNNAMSNPEIVSVFNSYKRTKAEIDNLFNTMPSELISAIKSFQKKYHEHKIKIITAFIDKYNKIMEQYIIILNSIDINNTDQNIIIKFQKINNLKFELDKVFNGINNELKNKNMNEKKIYNNFKKNLNFSKYNRKINEILKNRNIKLKKAEEYKSNLSNKITKLREQIDSLLNIITKLKGMKGAGSEIIKLTQSTNISNLLLSKASKFKIVLNSDMFLSLMNFIKLQENNRIISDYPRVKEFFAGNSEILQLIEEKYNTVALKKKFELNKSNKNILLSNLIPYNLTQQLKEYVTLFESLNNSNNLENTKSKLKKAYRKLALLFHSNKNLSLNSSTKELYTKILQILNDMYGRVFKSTENNRNHANVNLELPSNLALVVLTPKTGNEPPIRIKIPQKFVKKVFNFSRNSSSLPQSILNRLPTVFKDNPFEYNISESPKLLMDKLNSNNVRHIPTNAIRNKILSGTTGSIMEKNLYAIEKFRAFNSLNPLNQNYNNNFHREESEKNEKYSNNFENEEPSKEKKSNISEVLEAFVKEEEIPEIFETSPVQNNNYLKKNVVYSNQSKSINKYNLGAEVKIKGNNAKYTIVSKKNTGGQGSFPERAKLVNNKDFSYKNNNKNMYFVHRKKKGSHNALSKVVSKDNITLWSNT